jgi:PAS domain S-box-containing protein
VSSRLALSSTRRYGVAVAASLVALLLNVALVPWIGPNTFPPFLAAVMVATWSGGLGPGLAAIAITTVANHSFVVGVSSAGPGADTSVVARQLLYVLSATVIVALGTMLRSAEARAVAAAREARRPADSLRESDRNVRTLLESVGDYAVVMVDPGGRIVRWSPGATHVYGWTEAEILGQSTTAVYPADEPDAGRVLAAAAESGRVETQGWRVRKDGTRFWADVTVTPSYDEAGTLVGFWAVSRDVTERKRGEDALRASEARFRKLLELAPDAIVIVNAAGRMVLVNSQTQTLFGYAEAEMLDQPVEILLPEAARARHEQHRGDYVGAPRARPMGVGLELAGQRKDGTEFPVEISLSPMQTDEGLLVMSAIRDVTARTRTEAHIKALNEDLERRVAELAAVNREIEAFSYSVSHDLRAPLRSIDGFSQALLEECGDALTGDGRDYLRRVRTATQRMGELIDDLLNLARVTRREMRREPVDLSALARLTLGQLQKTEPDRAVDVAVGDGFVAWGDPHLPRLVLQHLLGNAWKFTSKQAAARIEFGMERHADAPVYYVRDNGVGFDMAYSEKLFGAFQRLHAMTEFPGTGIGLATVQRIVTRHGGRVWAEAAVGTGATFYFTL